METHSKCRLSQYLNHKFILEETRKVFRNEINLYIKFHLRKKHTNEIKTLCCRKRMVQLTISNFHVFVALVFRLNSCTIFTKHLAPNFTTNFLRVQK